MYVPPANIPDTRAEHLKGQEVDQVTIERRVNCELIAEEKAQLQRAHCLKMGYFQDEDEK